MFKYLYTIAAYLVILTPVIAQNSTDSKEMNLYGNVKQINEIKYKAIIKDGEIYFGDIVSDFVGNPIYLFNRDGNITKKTIYNADGTYREGTINLYDKRGKLLRSSFSSGFLKHKTYYSYKRGLKKETIRKYLSSNNITQTKYKYDRNKNLIEEIFISPNDNSGYKRIIFYDYNGHEKEKYFYNKNGSLKRKSLYSTDANGNIIKATDYINSKVISNLVLQFDSNNNRIELISYDSKGKLSFKSNYNYTYDNYNNWTQRIDYMDGKVTHIVVRKIVYY